MMADDSNCHHEWSLPGLGCSFKNLFFGRRLRWYLCLSGIPSLSRMMTVPLVDYFCVAFSGLPTSKELILGPNCSWLYLHSNDVNSLKGVKVFFFFYFFKNILLKLFIP